MTINMMFLLFAPMTGGYRGLGTAITQSITLYHFKLFLISIDFHIDGKLILIQCTQIYCHTILLREFNLGPMQSLHVGVQKR